MKKSDKTIIKLTDKQKEQLKDARWDFKKAIRKNKSNKKAVKKIDVILLRNSNHSIEEIAKETNLKVRTVYNYIQLYKNNNFYDFVYSKYVKSELVQFKSQILKEFHDNPVRSYREARDRIEKLTGIKRSITQVKKFLNSNHIYSVKKRRFNYIARRKLKAKIQKADLEKYAPEIVKYFEKHPCDNYNIAIKVIKKITKIKLCKPNAIKFLNEHGIYSKHSRKKPRNTQVM